MLADVLLNPRFDGADFDGEKRVILEERARRADMRQIIWDLYDLTLWQAHPLRHRVLGCESVVAELTMDDEDVLRVADHYFDVACHALAMVGPLDEGSTS